MNISLSHKELKIIEIALLISAGTFDENQICDKFKDDAEAYKVWEKALQKVQAKLSKP